MKASDSTGAKLDVITLKRSIGRKLRRMMVIGVVTYLGAAIVVMLFQRNMIYHPPVFSADAVNEMAATEHLERWTNSYGDSIGWKRLARVQPALATVLITHGNAGCAFQCGHYADVIQQDAMFDVFIVEYAGYADNPGNPSETALFNSATKALQSLPSDKPLYLVGESLGTGVAAYLAGKFPSQIAGVALLAPYKQLADVAQVQMPVFPVRLLLWDRFQSADHLRTYHGPIAMLVAGDDQVIPERFGQGLFDSYSDPKKLWKFPHGNHGTVMTQPPEVWGQIIQFWESHQVKPNA